MYIHTYMHTYIHVRTLVRRMGRKRSRVWMAGAHHSTATQRAITSGTPRLGCRRAMVQVSGMATRAWRGVPSVGIVRELFRVDVPVLVLVFDVVVPAAVLRERVGCCCLKDEEVVDDEDAWSCRDLEARLMESPMAAYMDA
jgi:hypothetical protein